MRYIDRKVLLVFLVLIFVFTLIFFRIMGMSDNIANNVLRLHIVANSNCPTEQRIKLKIRDSIIEDYGYLFSKAEGIEKSVFLAERYKKQIEKSANGQLLKEGCLLKAKVNVGDRMFPTKDYKKIKLPQGIYRAIAVDIGSARGENWWCVMYPPLCLSEGSIRADEETARKLREELTYEEYELITKSEEINVKVKFKLAEVIGKLLRRR